MRTVRRTRGRGHFIAVMRLARALSATLSRSTLLSSASSLAFPFHSAPFKHTHRHIPSIRINQTSPSLLTHPPKRCSKSTLCQNYNVLIPCHYPFLRPLPLWSAPLSTAKSCCTQFKSGANRGKKKKSGSFFKRRAAFFF